MASPSHKQKRASLRARRRRTRILAVGCFAIVIITAASILMYAGGLNRLVLPAIENRLGATATAERVLVTISGDVVIQDLTLELKNQPGESARFMKAKTMRIGLDASDLLRGTVTLESIQVIEPELLVSASSDFVLNLAKINPGVGSTSPLRQVPEIGIIDGVVVLAEHDDLGAVREFSRLNIQGSLRRDPDDADRAVVQLVQNFPAGTGNQRTGFRISGDLDVPETMISLKAEQIDLAHFQQLGVPERIRDVWETLNIRGEVTSVQLDYDVVDRLRLGMVLDGVNMNIPIPADALPGSKGSDQPIRVEDVSGSVAFDETGLSVDVFGSLEDLPYSIELDTDGLSTNAPLSCIIKSSGYKLTRTPKLLPFAPKVVTNVLERFGSPVARLNTTVLISRGAIQADGSAGNLDVSGSIEISDGTAAYSDFPYPFEGMQGLITFDENAVRIVRLTGFGPSGAKLFVTGHVMPPGDGAEVKVDAYVYDLPTDEHLENALPPSRRSVVDLLFSKRAYTELITALETLAADGESDSSELLQVIQEEQYEPGGTADFEINVLRPLGQATRYSTDITLSLQDAGILPSAFPYPAIADRLVVFIDDQPELNRRIATVREAAVRGLSGMVGNISGDITLSNGPGKDRPSLWFAAHDVPVDRLLLQALPAGEEDASPRELVDTLNLDGMVTVQAHIRPPLDPRATGNIGFTAEVQFRDIEANPGGNASLDDPESVALSDVRGILTVTEERLELQRLEGILGSASFYGDLEATFDLTDAAIVPELSGQFIVDELAVHERVEKLIEALADDVADQIAHWRERFRPYGRLDAQIDLTGKPNDMSFFVTFDDINNVSFDALDGRVTLSQTLGRITAIANMLRFENFSAELSFEDEPAGRIRLDGYAEPGDEGKVAIEAELLNSELSSKLVRSIVGEAARAADLDATLFYDASPAGIFDAAVLLSRERSGQTLNVSGQIEPKQLAFTHRDHRIEFENASGVVHLSTLGGRFEDLTLSREDLEIAIGGGWKDEGDSIMLDATLDIASKGIPSAVRALMPTQVNSLLGDLEVATEGEILVENANLQYRTNPSVGEIRSLFEARLDFDGLDLVAVAPIEKAEGRMDILVRTFATSESDRDTLVYRVESWAETLHVSGFNFQEGHIIVVNGRRDGQTVIPYMRARTYEGVLSGRAAITLDPNDPKQGDYEFSAEISRINFGKMLLEVGAIDPDTNPEYNPERGELSANIAVTGKLNDDSTRRGRGLLRIQDGDILDAPGIIPILTLSNLQIPTGEVPDLAYTDFYVQGDRIVYPEITITQAAGERAYEGSFWIEGSGEMLWPDLDLDLRFVTRGRRHIPLVSELLQGVRDEIVTTRVTGTLYDPIMRYEQLTATRQLIDSIFGPSERPNQPSENEQNETP